MNSFTLTAVGNLARNPEFVAKNDISYARFCLVGNDYAGKDEGGTAREITTSIWFVAFGAMGEALARNGRKGDQLVVQARVRANNWTDKQGEKKFDHSFIVDRQEFINVRERWATLTNEALRDAHVDARIDHRSLAAQGIDREPLPAIPLMHLKMEQRGLQSGLAEHLRAQYRDSVARRLENTAAGVAQAIEPPVERAVGSSTDAPGGSTDVEQIRRRAREAWLQLRATEQQAPNGQSFEKRPGSKLDVGERDATAPSRSPEDDLAL
jgi:single-stranded DNA-binding protein